MERQKTKCLKCGQDIYEDMKNCPNCNARNTNYTYFYLGQQAIKVSKSTFAFLIAIPCFFVLLLVIFGIDTQSKIDKENVSGQNVLSTEINYISYEKAFDYIKNAEENIKRNNKYNTDTNEYNESAFEFILTSDEYAGLYCAYWSALTEIGDPKENRYEKSMLRWQVDFTNSDWKDQLVKAYNSNGEQAFFDEVSKIYNEQAFPIIEKKWKESQ
ncbi:MAG: hypothetical protein ACI4U6_03970 [Acutalibacteraceae bacterium]